MRGFVAFTANEQRIDFLAYRGPHQRPNPSDAARESAPAIYRHGKRLSVQPRQPPHPRMAPRRPELW